jgi:hypothetical protein
MKTTTYPEVYLLITDNGSGENTIIELGVNALLDIETLVTNYFDALGISVSIETGIGKDYCDYYAAIKTDGAHPDDVRVWDSCGVFINAD